MGAITSADLMRALSIQNRHDARLGDILRAHGLSSEAQVMQALAAQHATTVLDPAQGPPDPRLIDAFGPSRCLGARCLPWRRSGAVTVVATSAPDRFQDTRPELEAALGPVSMVLLSEADLHAALIATRQGALRLMAETCVRDRESCRNWDRRRFSLGVGTLLTGLLVTGALAPVVVLTGLFALVTLALMLGTVMKLAAALAMLRFHRQARIRPPTPEYRKPQVSIMVPLYHEPDIAPRLVARLGALSWPRELLDILLVVEEDDHMTRAALAKVRLPHWMRVIPVPSSPLKTKPRALNYALNFARGSLIGVYDAEDAPSPDQIHRVAARFAQAGPDLACIQGVLDYYNPATNWLSRCFTIEYAAWFRVLLPGIERLGLAVPLGGTTLFFRREVLDSLGGWDAHNVTEDADLGVRLARHGYRTEVLDTVTQEEANCRLWPWVKQRSRWLKGYAMTYVVHMRAPRLLWRQLGPRRFLGFQVLFLGTLVQFLLAPLLWSFWGVLLGIGHPVTDAMPWAVVMAIGAVFAVSELTNLVVNMAALSARDHRFLRPWVLTLPLYFPLAVVAAYKGCWEMLVTPFYWDKTAHGLHDTTTTPPAAPQV